MATPPRQFALARSPSYVVTPEFGQDAGLIGAIGIGDELGGYSPVTRRSVVSQSRPARIASRARGARLPDCADAEVLTCRGGNRRMCCQKYLGGGALRAGVIRLFDSCI